ncbi:MAG: caspase family protein [Nannocystaceae bacterium]
MSFRAFQFSRLSRALTRDHLLCNEEFGGGFVRKLMAVARRQQFVRTGLRGVGWVLCAGVALSSGIAVAALPSARSSPRLAAWAPNEPMAPVVAVERFALLVGANHGGGDRVMLQYAGADAKAVARVMRDIGGVGSDSQALLTDPEPADLQGAFSELARRVEAAKGGGRRVEFVFYYSGHSDESGLLLGERQVPYATLREWIDTVPADVIIAILDSCASGAFTRLKGGTKRAPFLVGSSAVKGHAFLASSSADEAAQESDRVGGSFFTHFLVTGLRGAADVDKNRQVTLNEAYRFAFDETLARTETTQGGPQHPAYDIRLSGSGDLIMTDLRETTATVELAASLRGRVYVRDVQGNLVAELFKGTDAGVVRLALEPGTYQITVDDGKKHWRASFEIGDGRSVLVEASSLTLVEVEPTVTRGVQAEAEPTVTGGEQAESEEVRSDYQTVPVNVGIVPPLSINAAVNAAVKDKKVTNNWSFDLVWGQVDRLEGAAVSLGGSLVKEDLQGAQVALGVSSSGGMVHGAQLSIGLNHAKGPLEGGQAAVGANIVEGDVRGVQLAVGGNIAAGHVDGFQGSLGINVAADGVSGVQASAGINVARKKIHSGQVGNVNVAPDVSGAQLSIGLNHAKGPLEGGQAAVGANIVEGDVRGVQLAVGGNITAGHVDGFQGSLGINLAAGGVSGVQASAGINVARKEVDGGQVGNVNVAPDVSGAQIGLLNLATGRVDGVQIGLVNYADDADASIGLIGITRKGGVRVDAFTSDIAVLNLAVRLRARHTYTMFAVGAHPSGSGAGVLAGLGFGGYWYPVPDRIWLALDAVAMGFMPQFRFRENPVLVESLRLTIGAQAGSRFSVWGGPTFNVAVDTRSEGDRRRPGYSWTVYETDMESAGVRLWPGFVAGVEF